MNYREAIKQPIELDKILGVSNIAIHAKQRHFFWWIMNINFKISEISRIFNRNHSTVLHGINKVAGDECVNDEYQFIRYSKIIDTFEKPNSIDELTEQEIEEIERKLKGKYSRKYEKIHNGYKYEVLIKKIWV